MSIRSKALQITPEVREIVKERDGQMCILCPSKADDFAHIIEKSAGGLGIEENVASLCRTCHTKYDRYINREWYENKIAEYMNNQYENWQNINRVYQKGML